MMDWKLRLRNRLEPILGQQDPRPDLSAYRDMPLCIFVYAPKSEFSLREELSLLQTRLEQKGKRIVRVSLMECLIEALENAGVSTGDFAEQESGLNPDGHIPCADTIQHVLSEVSPLDQLVLDKIPENADPHRDILWLTRTGSLYPCYRTSTLVEHFQAKLVIPGVLFYPGEIVPPAGLSFMGVHDAEHNYRAKLM